MITELSFDEFRESVISDLGSDYKPNMEPGFRNWEVSCKFKDQPFTYLAGYSFFWPSLSFEYAWHPWDKWSFYLNGVESRGNTLSEAKQATGEFTGTEDAQN